MRYSAIVPSPFTFDVLPIAKRTVAVATLAAAWGIEAVEPPPKGVRPVGADILEDRQHHC